MAKQYGLNEAVDFAAANLVSFGGSFTRLNGQPIDKSQLWYPIWENIELEDGTVNKTYKTGFERAQAYAATNAAFVGQELAVILPTYTAYADTEKTVPAEGATVTGTTVTFYGIQDAAGTLKELGSKPLGDNASIAIDSDSKIHLYGFEEAGDDTLPQKQKDGTLKWVSVSTIVAGDGNSVTTITAVDNSLEFIDKAEEDFEGHKYEAKVRLSQEEGNTLELKEDGLYVNVPTIENPEYTIVKSNSISEGSQATYYLAKDNVQTGEKIEIPKQVDYTVSVSEDNIESANLKHYIFSQNGKVIAHIDIPKDLVVESGKVEVKVEAGDWGEAGTYIVLTIAHQSEPLYINAKDLVDIYEVESTDTVNMAINSSTISANVKISTEADNIIVAKSDGLYVPATKLPTEENFGVLSLTGENAIEVDNSDEQNPVVKLLIDPNGGNVVFTQSDAGLKAEVTIPEPTIPDVEIADSTEAEETEAKTIAVITKLLAENHIITPETSNVVTEAGLTAATTVKQYKYTYNDTNKEWTQSTVNVSLPEALVIARVDKSGETITGGIAGLITPEEKNKLAALVIGEGGGVEISGTINADNVVGLASKIADTVTGNGEGQLNIEAGAEQNIIVSISLPDAVLSQDENRNVAIPFATFNGEEHKTGIVKGSKEINKISFSEGIGEVNSLSTDKLVQGDLTLVLNAGDVSIT